MDCFCFVSFGRTVSSILLHKKKLVTEVTLGWGKFKVISEEIVNEQKWLHFAMHFLSTQKGYDFAKSAMKHWLFAFGEDFVHGFHGVITSIHIIPHPPHFHQKKLRCHDMISVCHNHDSTNGLVGGLVVINPRNGGFRWLDAFFAWHTVSQSPGDCRGHKNATKTGGGIRWSDEGPKELKGVLRWMKGRLFSTFFWLRSGFG